MAVVIAPGVDQEMTGAALVIVSVVVAVEERLLAEQVIETAYVPAATGEIAEPL